MKRVLVTGGCGYIGSHVVLALLEAGYHPIVIDNMSTGWPHLVPRDVTLYYDDIERWRYHLDLSKIDAIIHLAGSISVPESIQNPKLYYQNNTINSFNLINDAKKLGVKHFVFSSSAAVYGYSGYTTISEEHHLNPISPYGRSKLMTEQMLKDICSDDKMNYAALRYFNVAGADPQKRSGQIKSNHLIKLALRSICRNTSMYVYGDDYSTPDGTCIRDYIHVSDLARAHVLALEKLMSTQENYVMNCGYGKGYSVKEILTAVENVTGKKLNIVMNTRREGDPDRLVADNQLIKKTLNFNFMYDDINTIIEHAYEFEKGLIV